MSIRNVSSKSKKKPRCLDSYSRVDNDNSKQFGTVVDMDFLRSELSEGAQALTNPSNGSKDHENPPHSQSNELAMTIRIDRESNANQQNSQSNEQAMTIRID